MLPYFILGVALLIGVMLASRWFATANPKALAKGVKWAILGVLVGAALLLVVSGRLFWALAMLPALLMWIGRIRAVARMAKNFSRMSQAAGGAPGGGSSDVETRYLRMSLDHATGAMDGEVIEGTYAGQRLGNMSVGELVDLLKTCWVEDEQSARVLETYLDRAHADWRADAAAPTPDDDAERTAKQGPMTAEEAYKVLGLEPGADADAIKEAHRRLMAGLHPDRGGSDYLAAKINQAKDLLTGRH